MDITDAVLEGHKAECAAAAEKLLSSGTDPMEVINGKLIPALDTVGAKFEKGTIFLPQLIQSAGAAQAAFDVIKKAISDRGGSGVSSGRVVLCTVKGDIHDIGKNIVKTLLENYGFDVIDLGKDVDYQDVVDAAIKYDVRQDRCRRRGAHAGLRREDRRGFLRAGRKGNCGHRTAGLRAF